MNIHSKEAHEARDPIEKKLYKLLYEFSSDSGQMVFRHSFAIESSPEMLAETIEWNFNSRRKKNRINIFEDVDIQLANLGFIIRDGGIHHRKRCVECCELIPEEGDTMCEPCGAMVE